jgi:hypothetical protein
VRKKLIIGLLVVAGLTPMAMVFSSTDNTNDAQPSLNLPKVPPKVVELSKTLGCPSSQDPLVCLDSRIEDTYKNSGVSGLISTINEWKLYVGTDGLPCHRLTHIAGKRAAEVRDVKSAALESIETKDLCANGFFHGVVEGMSTKSKGTDLVSALEDLCSSVGDLKNDCIHSSGHSFAMDQPNNPIAALRMCDAFDPASDLCGAGVFMTFGRGIPGFEQEGSARWIKYTPEIAKTLCNDVPSKHSSSCWFQLWIAYQEDPNLGGVGTYKTLCPSPSGDEIKDPKDAFKYCYRGLGMLYMQRGAVEPRQVTNLCPKDEYAHYWCVFAIGWEFMNDHYLAVNSTDGYKSPCGDLSSKDEEICKEGEEYALIPGDGL